MADYTIVTDFALKDSLSASDPEKVILGQDITTDLEAISTSIATKNDLISGPTEGIALEVDSSGDVIEGLVRTTDGLNLETETLTSTVSVGSVTLSNVIDTNSHFLVRIERILHDGADTDATLTLNFIDTGSSEITAGYYRSGLGDAPLSAQVEWRSGIVSRDIADVPPDAAAFDIEFWVNAAKDKILIMTSNTLDVNNDPTITAGKWEQQVAEVPSSLIFRVDSNLGSDINFRGNFTVFALA